MSRDIPTPDGRAGLAALRALLGQGPLAALEDLRASLGDCFLLPLPGFSPVVLAGPEAARLVYVGGRDRLRWRLPQDPVTRLLRHGMLVEDGEVHDALRRTMNPALHRRTVAGYAAQILDLTEAELAAWPRQGSVEMVAAMRRLTLRTLTACLLGEDIAPRLGDLWGAVLKTLRYIGPGAWLVWPHLPRPGYRRARRRLDAYLFDLIRRRRQAANPDQDLLGVLLQAGLGDDAIRDQLLTMLIAGHDTSTAQLSWALHLLSLHPEVQARAREEVRSAVASVGSEALLSAPFPYLEAVLDETLRLYPPIHASMRRVAQDLDFRGHRIPAGSRLLFSIYLTHRHPEHWESPSAFDPDRFLPPRRASLVPYSYIPFGGGPRNCIGLAFARQEARLVLARLLLAAEFLPTGHPVRPHMGATLEPAPGLWLRIRRFERAAASAGAAPTAASP